ncbi:DUF547 domain-containing protein [Winogradskyella thalassocola]|uniref:DUF547 domain-containing protein n=1 Tax=Winogradskyella thalassocola TaxID=262004 RepID=A0A1G7YIL6_9FLAO|nr:DUF547 domain-containing protein [Winogradskyella thalassocola]SDG95700.1 Protein of unknown function, DUF547 [Winogradskyella thalassocola]
MKYLSVLIVTLIFTSSCSGLQKTTENQKNVTVEVVEMTETSKLVDVKIDNPIESKNNNKLNDSSDYILKTKKLHDNVYVIKITSHEKWQELLQSHVSDIGNVNYNGIQRDKKKLKEYITYLSKNLPTEEWMKTQKLAYWINAYNALTVDLILRNYPTKSIKDIKDPWDQRLWKFGDTWQNLNDIEHKILRNMDEPRIHFAIVCASVSCPKLQNEAFTASNLDAQLTKATKEFLADSTKNELSKDQIKISKIFKWFKKDFEQSGSLIDFLNQYSDITISESAKKSYTDYNWDLND